MEKITRRKLPIGGMQVFRNLRNECDVYVDKTMHVYEMVTRYRTVFMARPRRFGKSLLCSTIESLFLAELSHKHGRVVVIIDEYDHPLLDTINMPELNAELRETLKGFYSVIKQNEQHIRFAFITGITKFAQVSLFSGFNQPQDITMDPEYCDICGITQEELETHFAPEIDMYAPKHGGREKYLERLKDEYNGYYFTREKKSVYNTFGLLHHFNKRAEFAPFWSLSGVPTFLDKYLKQKNVDITSIENVKLSAKKFADYKDDTITLIPLLYQAGYLTITDYDEETGLYELNYPNREIRKNFAEYLADHYIKAAQALDDSACLRLNRMLLAGNADEFIKTLKLFLAKVDYSLSSRITEYYFEFAVSTVINMLGLTCVNEAHTANGRMDSVIHAGGYIYIFEFKVDKPVEDALWQIEDKDYAAIFADEVRRGKKMVKVGVVFSRENKNIVSWEIAPY